MRARAPIFSFLKSVAQQVCTANDRALGAWLEKQCSSIEYYIYGGFVLFLCAGNGISSLTFCTEGRVCMANTPLSGRMSVPIG